ncbi:MAG: DNA ligase-associated DEXH box helicase [Bryobacteraceae bacterium]
MPLLALDPHGLYCPTGDFYIDPWAPVDRAVITHAHADRARPGSRYYLTAETGVALLGEWLGPEASVQPLPYGHPLTIGECSVSLHPAGHILGSAQVRIEHRGEVWVVSGDYNPAPDPTCAPFEPLACHTFVTESTFGLPIFRWPQEAEVLASIQAWWRANREAGRTSVLFANPLGTAQRLLASLDGAIGPIHAHQEVERFSRHYRAQGIYLGGPPGSSAAEADASRVQTPHRGRRLGPASAEADGSRAEAPLPDGAPSGPGSDALAGPGPEGTGPKGRPGSRVLDSGAALVLAPPAAQGTPWMRRFANASTAMASGWMRIRGPRRRRTLDRGFVLSAHADWPALLAAIAATRAETIWVTHGQRAPLVRWLAGQGRTAVAVEAHFAEDET